MTKEELEQTKASLNFQYDYWRENLVSTEQITFTMNLFNACEMDRAASAKYKIQMKLGGIEQELREVERQIRLLALEEIELELEANG